jgi:conjugative transfer signal peptidase TraF
MVSTLSTALLLAVPLVLLCGWLVVQSGLGFDLTCSLPHGLYRALDERIDRGRLVLVCLPGPVAAQALECGYLQPGSCPSGVEPVEKISVTVPADLVGIDDRGVQVHGELLAGTEPQLADSGGRPLPRLSVDPAPLAPGQVIVTAPHPRSFDSRYFGSISTSQIVAVVDPATVGHRSLGRVVARNGLADAAREAPHASLSGRSPRVALIGGG